jgi:hypothetical protein
VYADLQLLRDRVEHFAARATPVYRVLARTERPSMLESFLRPSHISALLLLEKPGVLDGWFAISDMFIGVKKPGGPTNDVANAIGQEHKGCAGGALCISADV